MVDFTLDAKGLKCPMPVLKAKKIIKKMEHGQSLKLIADDIGAKVDIPALLSKTGCSLIEDIKEENGVFTFLIKKD
ncbi:MAG: sulfurtransferase TusA family protein [Promethearchaeota archaeon]